MFKAGDRVQQSEFKEYPLATVIDVNGDRLHLRYDQPILGSYVWPCEPSKWFTLIKKEPVESHLPDWF